MSDPKPPRIFYTELNSVHVSVYAELEGEYDWADGWRITGNVYGPHCSLSDTLPARIKLKDRGNGQSLLSAAIVPDPCPWSAALPAIYRVSTEILNDDQTLGIDEQLLGFKTLAVKHSHFVLTDLNGFTKRWVLRAAAGSVSLALSDQGEECRELRLSRVVTNPTRDECQQSTEQGLWLVAVLDLPETEIQAKLDELSQWPCVALCILSSQTDSSLSITAPNNLLLAAYDVSPESLPDWAQLIAADVSNVESFNNRYRNSHIPVLAHHITDYNNDRKARETCAQLQALLAPEGDYAGYIVSQSYLFQS